ncbi:antitoxin [Nanoarchaeota archaeon]
MRTIMIRDEVYEKLRKLKRKGESFSDLIERLIKLRKKRENKVKKLLEKYAGTLEDDELVKIIEEERKKFYIK